ncbi:GlsB/YeaQ/YmgE family stress response membrane protein [Corynebacterium tapiri]|uniref:GlsB/YeaQ/YmgE family stress response membrane protein n=1 Tax=Corynebacterium tapiri TaxID=1448266 RepID=A0A5C4U1A8_9CORY|nr:GlsB/YeaQ/YmgE family stress response membrane protein [Corynebacterium tapiri]TNL94636.1 GlsB/YeaQ/YmgE family stress response membrane protein [Corynebacterium tapiri]
MSLGMGIIGWIIIGGLAGWIASMIKGKNAQMGIPANIAAGVVGGLLGGFALKLVGVDMSNAGFFSSFLTCLVGAVVVLTILNMIRK